MNISFSPCIGDVVDVPISPPLHTKATLQFSAKISSQDHEALLSRGGRIQLWSDIPSQFGKNEWSELDFVEIHPVSSLRPPLTGAVSLDHHASHEQSTWILHVPVSPLSESPNTFFSKPCYSFTYRLVYPSGQVVWLGKFGRDGTIRFNRNAPSRHDLVCNDCWAKGETDNEVTYDLRSPNDSDGIMVGKLQRYSDYRTWILGKDSSNNNITPIILLLPHPQPLAVIMPQTYAICSHHGVKIQISNTGGITASGRGKVTLWNLNQLKLAMSDDQEAVFDLGDGISVIVPDMNVGYILGMCRKDENLVQADIIPFGSTVPRSFFRVEIRIDAFLNTLPNTTTQFCTFSSSNNDVQYFSSDPDKQGLKNLVSFSVDPVGSSFMMSPVHDIPVHERDNNELEPAGHWQVSVLSPHVVHQPCLPIEDSLPTPPLSPCLRPIARLSLESRTSTNTTISSVPSLLDGVTTPAPQDHAVTGKKDIVTKSLQIVRQRVAPADWLSLNLGLLIRIWRFLLNLILRVVSGNARHVKEVDDGTARNVGEKTQILREQDENEGGTGPHIRESVSTDPALLKDGQGHANIDGEGLDIDVRSSQPKSGPPDAFYVEIINGGTVTIAISAGKGSTNLTPDLKEVVGAIELNGKVPECVVRKVDSPAGGSYKTFLLEFEAGRGGWIKISPIVDLNGSRSK